jgi:hypothetical protein
MVLTEQNTVARGQGEKIGPRIGGDYVGSSTFISLARFSGAYPEHHGSRRVCEAP